MTTTEIHSAQDHKNAPTKLSVDWKTENTGTIFVKSGIYGIAIAVEKYPVSLWDEKFRKQMAKKYRKEGKKGLSVMIAHNQDEFDNIHKQFENTSTKGDE